MSEVLNNLLDIFGGFLDFFGVILLYPSLVVLDFYQCINNDKKDETDIMVCLFYYVLMAIVAGGVTLITGLVSDEIGYSLLTNVDNPHKYSIYYYIMITFSIIFMFLKGIREDKISIFDIYSTIMIINGIVGTLGIVFLRIKTGFNFDLPEIYVISACFFLIFMYNSKYLFKDKDTKYISIILSIYLFLSLFIYDISDIDYFEDTKLFIHRLFIPIILMLLINKNTSRNVKLNLMQISFYFISSCNALLYHFAR